MAPNRGLQAASDFDPEASPGPVESDDDIDVSSDDETGANAAREHYLDVGKSELRQPKVAVLGAQYRGSRITRKSVSEDEDSNDPFAGSGDSDSEGDSADADGGAEDAGGAKDLRSLKPRVIAASTATEKAQLASIAHDPGAGRSSLSQLRKADAEKGRGVKKQRATFDSFLGTRIKLQKAIVGVNTLTELSTRGLELQHHDGQNAIEKAEAAAFKLWSSLNDLREELIAARTGQKRKRTGLSHDLPIKQLWSHTQSQHEAFLPRRHAILQYWSRKTNQAKVQPRNGLVSNGLEHQATIMDTLQEQLFNPERMLKRVHTPRSCAPLQFNDGVTEDAKIYDDADFYGLLLKELLERKSDDSTATANFDVHLDLQREAKVKKNVDTKASKGRKMRYTVHEKLQNFMAPEDRRQWGDRQAEELFGSLFGQRIGLGEDLEDVDAMIDRLVEPEQGLVLFQS